MGYINKTGDEINLSEFQILGDYNLSYSKGFFPPNYSPKIEYYRVTGSSYSVDFDWNSKLWKFSFTDINNVARVVTSSTCNFTVSCKGANNYKEIVTPSINTSWRTHKKCNVGNSNLSIDHINSTSYKLTINDNIFTVSFFVGYFFNISKIIFNAPALSETVEPTMQANAYCKVLFDNKIKETYRYDASYECKEVIPYLTPCTVTGFVEFTTSGVEIQETPHVYATPPPYYYGGYDIIAPMMAASISQQNNALEYNYHVTDIDYGELSPFQLEFQGIGKRINPDTLELDTSGRWNGLNSPTFFADGQWSAGASSSMGSRPSYGQTLTYTPVYNFNNNTSWGVNDVVSTVGNVSLLDPYIINPADNGYYDTNPNDELPGEPILNSKILCEPELSDNASKEFYYSLTPKEFVNKLDWDYEDCFLQIDENTGMLKVTNVGPNAMLYIDNICHEQYNDESGTVDYNYRQKHFTKFRFLHMNSYSIGEGIQNEFGFTLTIKTKAYGDNPARDFVYSPLEIKDYFTETGDIDPSPVKKEGFYYDTCLFNANEIPTTDFQDSYMETQHPEKFQYLSGEGTPEDPYNVYRDEGVSSSFSYGPNVYGRVELTGFLEGVNYLMTSIRASRNPNKSKTNAMSRDEFKEPDYTGIRQPQLDEEDQHQFYQNRYSLFCIDGKRSFELPVVSKTIIPGSVADPIWNWYTMGILRYENEGEEGWRLIYPRDDFGEIHFTIGHYDPDADGHYPLQAMYSGDTAFMYWIKDDEAMSYLEPVPPYGYEFSIEHIGVKVTPRFDTLNGSNLHSYLKEFPIIKCSGVYGAEIQGITRGSKHIDFDDSSAFPDDSSLINIYDTTNYYNDTFKSNMHGTETEVMGKTTRKLENVIDGMKYNFSYRYFISKGKILRNLVGKILHNTTGRILRGNPE